MNSLRVARGHGARKPLRIRDWQKPMVKEVFHFRRRQSYAIMPRGQGKSTLAAAMGLTHVTTDFPVIPGPSCALVGSNEEQAQRILAVARRFVESSPVLAERAKCYRDRLVMPGWDAEIVAYPAAATALLGLDVSMIVLDELAAMPFETYEACVTGMGKWPKSMIFGIGSRCPVRTRY
jgi:phage terminase large subunit-like protein